MSKCKIIDTFPEFLTFWEKAKTEPTDKQIEFWASVYMSQWPKLLEKQQKDYSSQGLDWKQIAREKIFPFLEERLSDMCKAHTHLLKLCIPIYKRAQKVMEFESSVIFVIYVGIGCGAGWSTSFNNLPAILFGLENIAECGWNQPQTLSGMIAHEIGHVIQDLLRAQHGKANGSGPFWQLYCEGFAQRCEHVILNKNTWHQSAGDNEWLIWCEKHKGWLATEFLTLVDVGEPIQPFFGSWFDICGQKECGYFLGHELIRSFEATTSLKEIALWDKRQVEAQFRYILENIAGHGA